MSDHAGCLKRERKLVTELNEAREEVAFWKAETIEVRNVLSGLVEDKGALETAAIAYHAELVRREMPLATPSDTAWRLRGELDDAARTFAKAHAKALQPRRAAKKKRGAKR